MRVFFVVFVWEFSLLYLYESFLCCVCMRIFIVVFVWEFSLLYLYESFLCCVCMRIFFVVFVWEFSLLYLYGSFLCCICMRIFFVVLTSLVLYTRIYIYINFTGFIYRLIVLVLFSRHIPWYIILSFCFADILFVLFPYPSLYFQSFGRLLFHYIVYSKQHLCCSCFIQEHKYSVIEIIYYHCADIICSKLFQRQLCKCLIFFPRISNLFSIYLHTGTSSLKKIDMMAIFSKDVMHYYFLLLFPDYNC